MTDVHDINDAAATARPWNATPSVRTGQVLWMVPIRWWEPEDYSPERCVVLDRSDGRPQWEHMCPRVFNLYVHSGYYGHPVYVRGVDCFDTEDEARAEMARRTEVREAEYQEQAERLVEKILAERERDWLEVFIEDMEKDER